MYIETLHKQEQACALEKPLRVDYVGENLGNWIGICRIMYARAFYSFQLRCTVYF